MERRQNELLVMLRLLRFNNFIKALKGQRLHGAKSPSFKNNDDVT